MRFPPLEVMIQYGIYTVKELERFAKGLVPKRNINILSECPKCSFVHNRNSCSNCEMMKYCTVTSYMSKGQRLSVIITCVPNDN